MNRREILKGLGIISLASFLSSKGKAMQQLNSNAGTSSGKILPEVFVLGDSISIHYGPYLQRFIEGVATYSRKKEETINGTKIGSNGGNSKAVLDYVRLKLSDPGFHPDYILLNCGLHDIKRAAPANEFQVPSENYKQNLEDVFLLLQKRNIRIIWVRTTPVVDAIHNSRRDDFKRYAADLEAYNNVADNLCAVKKIPVVDLFTFTSQLPEAPEKKYIDNVHFNESTRILHGSFIAGFLKGYLQLSDKQRLH